MDGRLRLAVAVERVTMRLLLLCHGMLVLVFYASVTRAVEERVVVSVNSSLSRRTPRFGFGNELVWQNTNDTQIRAAVAASGSSMARYPGGDSTPDLLVFHLLTPRPTRETNVRYAFRLLALGYGMGEHLQ